MNIFDKIRRHFRPMLSCEQANNFIMDYLEDRLPAKTRVQFRTHLEKCTKCASFLDQYEKTVELVAEDGLIEVPADLTEHTLTFLREKLPELQS